MNRLEDVFRSDQHLTTLNIVGSVALVAGIVAMVFSHAIGQGIGAPSIAFFAPGMVTTILGISTLILNNCITKKPLVVEVPCDGEESADQSSSPSTPLSFVVVEQCDLAETDPSDFSYSPSSVVERLDLEEADPLDFTYSPPPVKAPNPTYPLGWEPNRSVLRPPVFPPTAVKNTLTERDASATLIAQIDANYLYQDVENGGDCFYIALLSALLYRSANQKDFGDLRDRLRTLKEENFPTLEQLRQENTHDSTFAHITPDNLATSFEQMEALLISDRFTDILSSHEKCAPFVLFFRALSAAFTQEIKDTLPRQWASEMTLFYFCNAFDLGTFHSDTTRVHAAMKSQVLGTGEQAKPTFVFQNGNHFDLLLPKALLEGIEVEEIAGDRPQSPYALPPSVIVQQYPPAPGLVDAASWPLSSGVPGDPSGDETD